VRALVAGLLIVIVAVAAACGGDDDGGETPCMNGENQAPATPTVLSPAANRFDIAPGEDLVLRTSPFEDADPDDHHVASELAIWQLAGGEEVVEVWTARRDEPDVLTEVNLSDGSFEVGDQLEERAVYALRVRYRDTGDCSAWSEWSEPRRFRTDDGSLYWFDGPIRQVRMTIPPASWDAIDAEAVPPDCVPYLRSYYPGDVEIDGESFPGSGIRAKGGCGSARHLDGKAAFKINLAWDDPAVPGCPEERRSHGLERLTLNNMVQDASFVHEALAYELFHRLGVPSPRAAHTLLAVNGEPWGLYSHVETIDRRLLWRWFDDPRGMLYEGTYWCDLRAENIPPGETDDPAYCLSLEFHPGECQAADPEADPETFAPLRELVAALDAMPDGAFYPEIEQIFQFDAFLSMWAAEEILNHWDGYVGEINNNYRVYHDPATDRWAILPGGVDQTFGDRAVVVTGRLARRCQQEEDCRAAYQARLAEAVGVFERADLAGLAATLRDRISDQVRDDPRKEVSHETFLDAVQRTIDFIQARPAQLR
jgi:hypothetical protein